jgi:hypothetical protein
MGRSHLTTVTFPVGSQQKLFSLRKAKLSENFDVLTGTLEIRLQSFSHVKVYKECVSPSHQGLVEVYPMASAIETKVQELVAQHGYDAQILLNFVEFIQSQPKPRKNTPEPSNKKSTTKTTASKKGLTVNELQTAVAAAFNCVDIKALKKQEAFKLATDGRELNLRTKEAWLILYREWVGVPENERHEEGPNCINGIDVLKNFRPWHVFNLDSKTATVDDINSAFRTLAKQYHPDVGGDRQVFERLQKMRDSILAFR